MNNFFKAVIVLSAFITVAQCLICYQCPLGDCLSKSNITCNSATESCFTGKLQFNTTKNLTLLTRGCLNSGLCGQTTTNSILNIGYNVTANCCSNELCNEATSVQLPLTVALCVAILSSLWGMWEL